MTKSESTARFWLEMNKLGFSYSESNQLRRIQLTLHRWAEREANGEIERDEKTGKPETVSGVYRIGANNERISFPVPDRETAALNRLEKIMANHPDLWYYHQPDPRGCALYIGKYDVLPHSIEKMANMNKAIEQYYHRGFGVCI